MNRRWVVLSGVFAAAACAVNHDHGAAGRSSSREEGADGGVMNDAGADAEVAVPSCVRTTRIPLLGTGPSAEVVDLNEHGHLIASAFAPGFAAEHAFYWNGTRVIDLAPESRDSQPKGLNDRGDVIFMIGPRSYVWRDGVRTDLGGSGDYTGVSDINELGQIVGDLDVAEDPGVDIRHAFLWENGVLRDLGTSGFGDALAQLINDAGMIVGYGFTRNPTGGPPTSSGVIVWENGNASVLSSPVASESLNPRALNEVGTIALWSSAFDGPIRSYLRQNGAFTAVTPFDAYDVELSALNDRGDVVGGVEIGPGGEAATRERRGFFWRAGVAQTVAAPSGAFVQVLALNNDGVAVGSDGRAVAWKNGQSIYLEGGPSRATAINQHGLVAGVAGIEARIWDVRGCFGGSNDSGDDDDDSAALPDAGASSSSGGHTW